jgi:parallel beta-helix repeat protein
VIERNDIVVDGTGYVLNGNHVRDSVGISLSKRNNVTIKNIEIVAFDSGVYLSESANSAIFGNNIWGNDEGIYLYRSAYNMMLANNITSNDCGYLIGSSEENTISGNNVTNNWQAIVLFGSSNNISENNIIDNSYGIRVSGSHSSNNYICANNITGNHGEGIGLVSSSKNTILENSIINNTQGLSLLKSSNNILRNNSMVSNKYNFGVDGDTLLQFINDIDTSNTVDNNPVYYWINEHEKSVPFDAGYLALVNCTGITIQSLNVTKNLYGIHLAFTSNSTIIQNKMASNIYAIRMTHSSNITIIDNYIIDNEYGVWIADSSGNEIDGNSLVNNENGIAFAYSLRNRVFKNSIINETQYGMQLDNSMNNNIFGNNISKSFQGIAAQGSDNNCLSSNVITDCYRGIMIGESYVIYGESRLYLGSNNNTIAENIISSCSIGVLVSGSSFNTLSNNTIFNTEKGISVQSSPWLWSYSKLNNSICYNTLRNNTLGLDIHANGIEIFENIIEHNELAAYITCYITPGCNNLANNTIKDNVFGLYLESNKNVLRNNEIFGNNYNFIETLSFYGPMNTCNDVDVSNTINGKPIYYLVNQTNLNIDPSSFPNVGYLALVDCSNVSVRGLTLTGNGQGILLSRCVNCTVEGDTIENNLMGIQAYTNNTSYLNNLISENYQGIALRGYYDAVVNNTIMNNTVRLSLYRFPENWPYHPILTWIRDYFMFYSGAIYLRTDNSTILNNKIINNENGILLFAASFNTLRNNNMTGNVHNFGVAPEVLYPQEWLSNPPESFQISSYLINDVDVSNTLNGKPVYWWISQHDLQVPEDAGIVILVNSTNIIASNLVLENNTEGLLLFDVKDSVISNNTICGTKYGILIESTPGMNLSVNNGVTHNYITDNGIGIKSASTNSIFSCNILRSNLIGIYESGEGHNQIVRNNITENSFHLSEEPILGFMPSHSPNELWYFGYGVGIVLESPKNTLCCNNLEDNDMGMSIGFVTGKGRDNKIYHNNFINNTEHVEISTYFWPVPENSWDNGYPSGGNYWSGYDTADLSKGFYQNETGSDGIGDSGFRIATRNFDNYPLMAPFNTFDAGIPDQIFYNVDIVSNSTISAFHFNPKEGAFLRFNVNVESGMVGFCRITIPRNLLRVEDGCTVLVGFEPVNYTMILDENYAYLYFTYDYSAKTVYIIGTHVIPEFPSLFILSFFITFSLLVTIYAWKIKKLKGKNYVIVDYEKALARI